MASSIIQKSLDNTLLKFKLPSQTDTDVKLQMVATDSFDDVDEHNDKNALTIFSVGGEQLAHQITHQTGGSDSNGLTHRVCMGYVLRFLLGETKYT
jgi:hypothetical protein